MADTKTSAEPAATALAGTELVPGVQSAVDVKITVDQLEAYVRLKKASPAFSATPTLDSTTGQVLFFGALTANVTAFNLSGLAPKTIVCFTQDVTGGRTVTAGTSIDFGTDIPDLSGLATAANAVTYVGFVYNPTTAKYRVVAISK